MQRAAEEEDREDAGGVDVKTAREGEERVEAEVVAEEVLGVRDDDKVDEEDGAAAWARERDAGRWMTSPGSVSSSVAPPLLFGRGSSAACVGRGSDFHISSRSFFDPWFRENKKKKRRKDKQKKRKRKKKKSMPMSMNDGKGEEGRRKKEADLGCWHGRCNKRRTVWGTMY